MAHFLHHHVAGDKRLDDMGIAMPGRPSSTGAMRRMFCASCRMSISACRNADRLVDEFHGLLTP